MPFSVDVAITCIYHDDFSLRSEPSQRRFVEFRYIGTFTIVNVIAGLPLPAGTN